MSSGEWKLENDLCRCCHAEGSFKNLAEPFISLGQEEVYSDMLQDCLNIDLTPVPGQLCAVTYTICEVCISRLRDATNFKKQVLDCELRFKDMYAKSFIKSVDSKYETDIKVEITDEGSEDFKEEYSQMDEDEDDDTFDAKFNEDDDSKTDTDEGSPKKKTKKLKLKPKPKSKTKKLEKPPKTVKSSKVKKEGGAVEKAVEGEKKGVPRIEDYVIELINTDKKYMCTACEIAYKRLADLRNHVSRAHLKQKLIKCPICAESFLYQYQRKDHIHTVHALPRPEKFECHDCYKRFTRKNTLAEHMMSVHIEKKCKYCNLKFTRKKYSFHMNEAHGVPMPTCGVCGLKTMLESSLIRHQRHVHLDEKNKTCVVCKKKFHKESNLRDHMITHNQDRVFKCDLCEKSFTRKEVLKSHRRLHTGERPYSCRVCNAAFVQRASLRFHIKKHHPGHRLETIQVHIHHWKNFKQD